MENLVHDHTQTQHIVEDGCSLKCWGITAVMIVVTIILLKLYFRGGVCRVKKDLTGKVAVVTGGNAGIGKETIKGLLRNKCRVIFGSRDSKKNQQVVEELKKSVHGAIVESYKLDLGDKKSVNQFAKNVKSSCDHIDILINNAGVMWVPERKVTADGMEMTMGINHFGHFYLTKLLWDYILKSKEFRIINLSSLANTRSQSTINFDDIDSINNYNPLFVYQKSKMANVLFTKELHRQICQKKLNGLSVCLHPGGVDTELANTYFQTPMKKLFFKVMYFFFFIIIKIVLKTPKQGAQTSLYLSLQDLSKLKGGEYYADCKVAKPGKQAFDEEAAKRLWKISENKYGVEFII